MGTRRTLWSGVSVFLAVGAMVVLVIVGRSGAYSGRVIVITDECDPATFNAAGIPGGCTRTEGKPLQEFRAEVAQDHAVGGWEFDPDSTSLRAGDPVSAVNLGGEVHTFTAVARFGNGFVQALNDPAAATAPECVNFPPVLGTFVPQGKATTPVRLSPGTHRFQCCIHPWMRTTITVETQ